MTGSTRRQLLAATALFTTGATTALARTVSKALPWTPNEAYPPVQVTPGTWMYLHWDEVAALDAIVSRLIPADALSPSGKDCGCTVFIDRQLAGPYGGHDWLYMQGPFPAGALPSQGLQSAITPRQQYRQGLAALAAYCRASFTNRVFAQLSAEEQDGVLGGLERGDIKLDGVDGRGLFQAILTNTVEGFFSDPVYGGNRDMAGWKMIGFPGTRYDYRDVMAKPNQPYTLPPVGLGGRPAWGQPV